MDVALYLALAAVLALGLKRAYCWWDVCRQEKLAIELGNQWEVPHGR